MGGRGEGGARGYWLGVGVEGSGFRGWNFGVWVDDSGIRVELIGASEQGLTFKAHRFLDHSALGLRVIKKQKMSGAREFGLGIRL